ncbi:MAG TPA: UDP-N-acetylmuramoyl-L-alanine--D-glutamate ligase, partial [Eubacteriaceae bacterium]|nr:UDP-N-acetylmuramoyl-L-alanine--D-glutamate ligase [Eubacteriaceae bacterium]
MHDRIRFTVKEKRMNKNILIIGMGKSGQALARYLGKEGHQLYLYDRKTEHQEEICEKLDLDQSICGFYDDNSVADVLNKIDEAVISPGISLQSKIARLCTDHSIPLIGEIEMAYRQARGDFIAITGTNGKTTTANLVYELIKREKQDVFLAGNIGTPLIDIVPFTTKNSVIVLEISSFQLETIQSFRPKASVVLNITPDHLDRHKTMEEYVRAKKRIAENCGEGDFFVYNEDDPIVREFQDFACEKISFSLSHPVK